MIFEVNMTNELLFRGSRRVGALLLLVLFLGGVGAGVLCQGNGGADGEAEAERHNNKLLHYVVISFESTMSSSFFTDDVLVSCYMIPDAT